MVSLHSSDSVFQGLSSQGGESFLRSVFGSILETYLNRNRTAKTIWELVQSVENEELRYDHFTFRTLGVNGYGIDSLSSFFLDYGYKLGSGLDFPAKKLRVKWFSPPDVPEPAGNNSSLNVPLPRIVLAEVLVDQLSLQAQEIIKKCLEPSIGGNKHGVLSSALGSLMWEKPSSDEFKLLAKENEYAAWVLVHGYIMNHAAISVHRMKSHLSNIKNLNQLLEENGFDLNTDGGVLKVSPDGLLQQIASVAETVTVEFSDGVSESVPRSYIEFTERLVLPQYKDVVESEIKEFHRRDGFEFESANNIMESTRFGTT